MSNIFWRKKYFCKKCKKVLQKVFVSSIIFSRGYLRRRREHEKVYWRFKLLWKKVKFYNLVQSWKIKGLINHHKTKKTNIRNYNKGSLHRVDNISIKAYSMQNRANIKKGKWKKYERINSIKKWFIKRIKRH